jgi:glucosyl-3-phosphoglycerate synthase
MVSVIIPALNEVANIEYVVALAHRCPQVGEVIVVDDGSVDGTPEAAIRGGARVITSSLLGKGASMADGLQAARGDILVYLDGDLRGLNDQLIELLSAPIRHDKADFVKARFSRSAGRVTALTARPLLQTFFPEIARFAQPLGGIIAVRRALLEKLHFETDYGVDLALLIDAHFLGARLDEVDIGHLEHDSQTLEALGEMAKQVVRALMHRAERHGRLSINQVVEVEEVERQSRAEFALVTGRLDGAERLALFDMDGTLLRDRSVVVLAKQAGRYDALREFLDRHDLTPADRARAIAKVLAGVPRAAFEEVARTMELSEGARETVVALRKEGYRVGIVSDSYRIITEIVRRRVFADFSVANLMRFRDGFASGDITLSPIFEHENGCPDHPICKWNVLLHLEEKLGIPASRILSVGDSANDICLLRQSGTGIAFEPKAQEVSAAADFVIHSDMQQVLAHLTVAK